MLIDGSNNTFLTQRQVPAIAKIRPSLPDDYDQVPHPYPYRPMGYAYRHKRRVEIDGFIAHAVG
jgi:hypothetical protein